tara:strand:+ start:19187 stop:19912 length:726 start_codon:yes stop_codon:yes gene_type:complete
MKKYGLIGQSLNYSFSRVFFKSFFSKHEIDAVYENIELSSIENIQTIMKEDYDGLNVTIPYKEEIIPYLDIIETEAREIGAVNVLSCSNGKLIGHNTDAYGFHQSIKPFLTNQHERAIIFGTGGASKAVEYVLKNLGVNVIFISRTPKSKNQFSYNDLNENMINACKLIVNCTPVGTFPDAENYISMPFSSLTKNHLVVDLVYNPSKSMFLQKAEERGAMILNGESMLKHQALKSWEIWNR